MSKLNPKAVKPVVSTNIRVVARARDQKLGRSANGNLQFVKAPLEKLYELAVSTLFGKQSDSSVKEMRTLIREAVDMNAEHFVANLAIHARTEMNIRTVPIVIVVEFAKALADKRAPILAEIKRLETAPVSMVHSAAVTRVQRAAEIADLRTGAEVFNYPHMRQLTCDVIQRADQINDLYAYALQVFGSKGAIPMAIKRGVADAFNKFGEYGFAKYNRDGSVKFRDVLRIVHPTAKDTKQGAIFDKIMKDTLETPYTWETELSANGSRHGSEKRSDKALWTQLVTSGKVGYMALLRNMRNIHQAGLDDDILRKHVLNVISDEVQVANSKQLPYDFKEAYNIVKPLNSKMATAISKAIDLSVSNIPQMGKKVWLIIDFSGSMGHVTAETSAISSALFLASALIKANADSNNLAITLFGSSAMTLKGIDTNNSMLAIQAELARYRSGAIAGSTNFRSALDQRSQLGFDPDTIIVLTDNEVNDFPYGVLRQATGGDSARVMKLTVNMSQSVTTPMVKQDGWYTLAGWSPAMFKWVPAIREKMSVVDQLSDAYHGLPEKPAR